MPAMVKRTVGSCGIRLADGTTAWSRSAKKRVKAALSPLASIAASLPGAKSASGPARPDEALAAAAQVDDIPTMGLLRWRLPVEPKNPASP